MRLIKTAIIILTCIAFTQSPEECNSASQSNHTWYKTVLDDATQTTRVMELDMSKGYVSADPQYIYMLVIDKITGDHVTLLFTNGQYFEERTSIMPDTKNMTIKEYLKTMPSQPLRKPGK
ncbi:hypothetical protein H8D85_01465 [bacterium]|nr:hypothetical protein [bacterium]